MNLLGCQTMLECRISDKAGAWAKGYEEIDALRRNLANLTVCLLGFVTKLEHIAEHSNLATTFQITQRFESSNRRLWRCVVGIVNDERLLESSDQIHATLRGSIGLQALRNLENIHLKNFSNGDCAQHGQHLMASQHTVQIERNRFTRVLYLKVRPQNKPTLG